MDTAFKETEEAISLHGLGFIQVKLAAKQRLHVWHPDLPRRRCFSHSAIHDHRFSFKSRVLVGTQINHVYRVNPAEGMSLPTHALYKHEGERSQFGNRPWIMEHELVNISHMHKQVVKAGEEYEMPAFVFHSTEPDGDGLVATLMTKLDEDKERGARSSCAIGVDPDVDFDRKQCSPDFLWHIVRRVMETAA